MHLAAQTHRLCFRVSSENSKPETSCSQQTPDKKTTSKQEVIPSRNCDITLLSKTPKTPISMPDLSICMLACYPTHIPGSKATPNAVQMQNAHSMRNAPSMRQSCTLAVSAIRGA